MSIRPWPPSIVRAPSRAWSVVAKGTLQRLQERWLVVLDLEHVLPTLLDNVRAQGALGKQCVAGDHDIVQIDLTHFSAAGSWYIVQRVADQILGADGAPVVAADLSPSSVPAVRRS